MNLSGYSWGWRNGACTSANPFHFRAKPVRSVSARNLNDRVGKTFLDHEFYDGGWGIGLDCVGVLCIGSSFPSECRSKVSINFCLRRREDLSCGGVMQTLFLRGRRAQKVPYHSTDK